MVVPALIAQERRLLNGAALPFPPLRIYPPLLYVLLPTHSFLIILFALFFIVIFDDDENKRPTASPTRPKPSPFYRARLDIHLFRHQPARLNRADPSHGRNLDNPPPPQRVSFKDYCLLNLPILLTITTRNELANKAEMRNQKSNKKQDVALFDNGCTKPPSHTSISHNPSCCSILSLFLFQGQAN